MAVSESYVSASSVLPNPSAADESENTAVSSEPPGQPQIHVAENLTAGVALHKVEPMEEQDVAPPVYQSQDLPENLSIHSHAFPTVDTVASAVPVAADLTVPVTSGGHPQSVVVQAVAEPENLSTSGMSVIVQSATGPEDLSTNVLAAESAATCNPEDLSTTLVPNTGEPVPENLSVTVLPNTGLPDEAPENLSVTVLPSTAEGSENVNVTVLPNTAMPDGEDLSAAVLRHTSVGQENGSGHALPDFSVMVGMGGAQDQHVAMAENLSATDLSISAAGAEVTVGVGQQVLVKGELPSPTASAHPPPTAIRLLIPESAASNGLPGAPPGQMVLGRVLVKGEQPSPPEEEPCPYPEVPEAGAEMQLSDNLASEMEAHAAHINMGHVIIKGEYDQQYATEEQQYAATDDQQYAADQHYAGEEQQYATGEEQQYATAEDQQYVTEEQQYVTTDDQQYATEDQQYATAEDQQYSTDAQYVTAEEAHYATEEGHYTVTGEQTGAGEVVVEVPQNLSSAVLSTPTLVQILRDPCTVLRGHPPTSSQAILVTSLSQLPENLSTSATQLSVASTYSRTMGAVPLSVHDNVAHHEVVSSSGPRLTKQETDTTPLQPVQMFANSVVVSKIMTAAQQQQQQRQLTTPAPVALCLSVKSSDGGSKLAVVKREVEYPDYTDYSYAQPSLPSVSRVAQFSPATKPQFSPSPKAKVKVGFQFFLELFPF
jgi:hypothetical protein